MALSATSPTGLGDTTLNSDRFGDFVSQSQFFGITQGQPLILTNQSTLETETNEPPDTTELVVADEGESPGAASATNKAPYCPPDPTTPYNGPALPKPPPIDRLPDVPCTPFDPNCGVHGDVICFSGPKAYINGVEATGVNHVNRYETRGSWLSTLLERPDGSLYTAGMEGEPGTKLVYDPQTGIPYAAQSLYNGVISKIKSITVVENSSAGGRSIIIAYEGERYMTEINEGTQAFAKIYAAIEDSIPSA
jgi:hypothetical protein